MSGAAFTVDVDLGLSRYPITIGAGLIGDADVFRALVPGVDLLVVTNTTVGPLYLEPLRAALPGRRVAECVLPDGEEYKTQATLGAVFDVLVSQRFNRDAVLLARGGGVIGDIAGFAAACYQRGIGFVQVPTTLLAQVDSSVGGKTGVNHPGGKNLIGAFHQPLAVIADTATLSTLPDRELRAGLAEVIKYGFICDPVFLEWLDENLANLLARDPAALTHAIARSCEIKAGVVAGDERERGRRAILNFGHTFGHAIEAATGFTSYLHGEAVAIGMVVAADLSHRLGLIDASGAQRVKDMLARAQLPTAAPRIGAKRTAELMAMDKKVLGGSVRLVLLEGFGKAVVSGRYDARALEATLAEHFG